MNRSYSRMRAMRSTRSRSVEDLDLVVVADSDLLDFSSAVAENNNKPTSKKPRTAERSKINTLNPSLYNDHQPESASDKLQQHKEEEVLSRSCSVSSSKRFGIFEKQQQQQRSIGAQCSAAIKKKPFSFTRSTSVSSESYYCRIHDQSEMTLTSSQMDEDEDAVPVAGSPSSSLKIKKKKKNNRGGNKIFKACKRIFGL